MPNLYECGGRYRKSGIGHFIDQTKKRWIVPASVAFSKARKAPDLYNQCAHITPASINDVNKDFDDSSWPSATVYSNDTIGVNNKPAYMNFSVLFTNKKAKFIWSSNDMNFSGSEVIDYFFLS